MGCSCSKSTTTKRRRKSIDQFALERALYGSRVSQRWKKAVAIQNLDSRRFDNQKRYSFQNEKTVIRTIQTKPTYGPWK